MKSHHRNIVIDVGTNSVHILVCDVGAHGQDFEVVLDDRRITRLGHGLALTNELQEEAMARTCDAIQEFVEEARRLGVGQVVASRHERTPRGEKRPRVCKSG